MDCLYCQSNNSRLCQQKTTLGYLQFRCRTCGKQCNERTGTTFNYIQYPTEVVMMAVHYYYRFRNSLDDVVELMLMRGFHLSHQTVHNWVQTFGVKLGLKLRERRYRRVGKKWHVTTDKEAALYPAITNVFGAGIKHRDSKYMNNIIE